MNDTHPALAVAELMRVFIDDHAMEWEPAWKLTRKVLGYTNHTLLPEALEKWSLSLLERVLPRHMQIIFGINHRFLRALSTLSWIDGEQMRKMSIIEEGFEKQVRMSHLAIVGSHAVNGVSALHSELLRTNAGSGFRAAMAGKIQQQDQRRGAPALAAEGQSLALASVVRDHRRGVDHRSGRAEEA